MAPGCDRAAAMCVPHVFGGDVVLRLRANDDVFVEAAP